MIGDDSIYDDTNLATLEGKHPEHIQNYRSVLAWRPFSGKGLVLVGPKGMGKTRIGWLLMRRLHDEGTKIVAFNAAKFGDAVTENYSQGSGPRWIREVSNTDVFFMDDLDKVVITDRLENVLYSVLEAVVSRGRYLVVTTNVQGEAFAKRFTPGFGEAIYRRISEFCKPIRFSPAIPK